MALVIVVGACSNGTTEESRDIIGVMLPDSELYNPDVYVQAITAKGYTAQVKITPVLGGEEQDAFIKQLVDDGAKAILLLQVFLHNVDSEEAHQYAKSKGVPIIAVDRFVFHSPACDYYVAVNNKKIGEAQGNAIRDKLNLDTITGTLNIALFAGDRNDDNAKDVFDGAMDVLNGYIPGKLNVVGPSTFEDCEITEWLPANAKTMMADLLRPSGAAAPPLVLHAVLAPNDNTASGIIDALEADSRYTGKTIATDFPIITGQDFSHQSLIEDEKLYMTVEKWSHIANAAVTLADQLIKGADISIPDSTVETMGGDIPAYLLAPVVITKEDL
jgi:putative multiple sugar transport system substrate-binding protein